jgi:hypothetical protein
MADGIAAIAYGCGALSQAEAGEVVGYFRWQESATRRAPKLTFMPFLVGYITARGNYEEDVSQPAANCRHP